MPSQAKAGILSGFFATFSRDDMPVSADERNLQTLALPKPAMSTNPTVARGGGDITIVDDSALLAVEGPSGTIADIERPKSSAISIYVVRQGDTLSSIAALFGVSANTIRWANDLSGSTVRVGQTLVILPVTGIRHTVQKGETLASIAKKYGGDQEEIALYNGIEGALAVGSELIIPDGEVQAPAPVRVASSPARAPSSPAASGAYIRPVQNAVRTQGIHGYNGVDLAAPSGTSVLASAAGTVIVSREGSWNGGYGNYIVIEHANGSQTLYAHNSDNIVGIGESVVQGQVIGYVGRTGKATGPHLHFEIRNGPRNPF